MKSKYVFFLMVLLLVFGCAPSQVQKDIPETGRKWHGVHLLDYNTDEDLKELARNVPRLTALGINTIILEVDYNFDYKSHPELRRGEKPVTEKAAHEFAALCRRYGIRLIPEFQCLGHQSWEEETYPLLTQYPEFDITPGAYPGNKGIYCREWDPTNPRINQIVFELMDELIDAFEADALHVGMDEVFLLGDEYSPSTRGKDPAELYAKEVNEIHEHLVTNRGVEMLMWGDRLIDCEKYDFGEWESAVNGTAPAVDMIPKDIIICPWHYELRDEYPSIPMFLAKGFRVLPAGWKNTEATKSLIRYSYKQKSPQMLGYLFTTWGLEKEEVLIFPPIIEGMKKIRKLHSGW
ncbi:MAG: family 20 glycosylhydrolase [Candidatus Aminicenantes bacterium]